MSDIIVFSLEYLTNLLPWGLYTFGLLATAYVAVLTGSPLLSNRGALPT